MKARGPYRTIEDWYARKAFGAFIAKRRRARNMTQKQYAEFLGVSLRTLVTGEQNEEERAPFPSGAIGYALGNREFASVEEMRREYDDYKAGIR